MITEEEQPFIDFLNRIKNGAKFEVNSGTHWGMIVSIVGSDTTLHIADERTEELLQPGINEFVAELNRQFEEQERERLAEYESGKDYW